MIFSIKRNVIDTFFAFYFKKQLKLKRIMDSSVEITVSKLNVKANQGIINLKIQKYEMSIL